MLRQSVTQIIRVASVSNLSKQTELIHLKMECAMYPTLKELSFPWRKKRKRLPKGSENWSLALARPSQLYTLRRSLADWATSQFWPWASVCQEISSHHQWQWVWNLWLCVRLGDRVEHLCSRWGVPSHLPSTNSLSSPKVSFSELSGYISSYFTEYSLNPTLCIKFC